MITFTPYATGSTGNIYTVSDGETTIMLDCGLVWNKIRQLLKFGTAGISGILLTHKHMDHCKGAADASKGGMEIYASRETFEALKVVDHRRNEVKDGERFSIGTWIIYPFAVAHDVEGALGFYMANTKGEAFLYLTDSAYSPIRFANLAVIAAECNFVADILTENILEGRIPWLVGRRIRRSHFSLENFVEMLKANDLSKCRELYLLHMSSGNADEARMIREVRRQTGIPTFAA